MTNLMYSPVRLFRSHSNKKKDFELSEIRIIRIHRERELKKMWMTDQKCRNVVQVCRGLGVDLTPFSLVAHCRLLPVT